MPVLIILNLGGFAPAGRLIFTALPSHGRVTGTASLSGPNAATVLARAPDATELWRVSAPGHAGAPSSILVAPPMMPAANVKLLPERMKDGGPAGKGQKELSPP